MNANTYSLYREELVDHYRNPRNFGAIKQPDLQLEVSNSSCGDELTLYLKLDAGVISEAKHESRGCAISVAAASILSGKLIGMRVEDLDKITEEDVLAMVNVPELSARRKCATLIVDALREIRKESANE